MAASGVVLEENAKYLPGYLAPYCEFSGEAQSALFHPEGYSLWKLNATVRSGSILEWNSNHGDEAVLVLDGALEHGGTTFGSDSALMVEAGIPTTVRALSDTQVLHFGPMSTEAPTDGPLGPALDQKRTVHAIDPGKEFDRVLDGVTWYSDGTCPTCRMMFFTVDRRKDEAPRTAMSHIHSQDEIIHVLDGAISVGRSKVGVGQAIAIPGDLRYGFRSDGGYRFVNYRRDLSMMVTKPGTPAVFETRAAAEERIRRGEVFEE